MTSGTQEKPTIVFVIRYFHPFIGGLEKKTLNLASALIERGERRRSGGHGGLGKEGSLGFAHNFTLYRNWRVGRIEYDEHGSVYFIRIFGFVHHHIPG